MKVWPTKLLVLSFLFCMITSASAFQESEMGRFTVKLDGERNDRITATTHDEQGNLYMTGYFTEQAHLTVFEDDPDEGVEASKRRLRPASADHPNPRFLYVNEGGGQQDGFIAKINRQGNIEWVKTFGGEGDDVGSGIAFHRQDKSLFVSGHISGKVYLKEDSLSNRGQNTLDLDTTTNTFIAALDAENGNWRDVNVLPIVLDMNGPGLLKALQLHSGNAQQANGMALAQANEKGNGEVVIYLNSHLKHTLNMSVTNNGTARQNLRFGLAGHSTLPLVDVLGNGEQQHIDSYGDRAFITKVHYYPEETVNQERGFDWQWMKALSSSEQPNCSNQDSNIRYYRVAHSDITVSMGNYRLLNFQDPLGNIGAPLISAELSYRGRSMNDSQSTIKSITLFDDKQPGSNFSEAISNDKTQTYEGDFSCYQYGDTNSVVFEGGSGTSKVSDINLLLAYEMGAGSCQQQMIMDLVTDPRDGTDSKVYIAGNWRNILRFNNTNYQASTQKGNGFVGSLSPQGGQWQRFAYIKGRSSINAIALDENKNILTAGSIAPKSTSEQVVNFVSNNGAVALSPSVPLLADLDDVYQSNGFVAKLSRTGIWKGAELSSNGMVSFYDMARGRDGSVYLAAGMAASSRFVNVGESDSLLGINQQASVLKLRELDAEGFVLEKVWQIQSEAKLSHVYHLHLNHLQTLYSFGSTALGFEFPKQTSAPLEYSRSTSDQVDRLSLTGTIANVINVEFDQDQSPALLDEFINYYDYLVGDAISAPEGTYLSQSLESLRSTSPIDITSHGGQGGVAYNKPLLVVTNNDEERLLYAAGPLEEALILWPTMENINYSYQEKEGRLIRIQWPSVAQGRQDFIYSLTSGDDQHRHVPAIPLTPNSNEQVKHFGWIHTVEDFNGIKQTNGLDLLDPEQNSQFLLQASENRLASLIYFNDEQQKMSPTILTVAAYHWRDKFDTENILIGESAPIPDGVNGEITKDGKLKSGFVMTEKSHYDASLQVYQRETRLGQIIPVNLDSDAKDDDLIVAWYQRDNIGLLEWPFRAIEYQASWPTVDAIVIASGRGSADSISQLGLNNDATRQSIYFQNDRGAPGYNPNEEHAFLAGDVVHAVRGDLNHFPAGTETSEPYVLLRYLNVNDATWCDRCGQWRYRVFKVEIENDTYRFGTLNGIAGNAINPPLPLSLLDYFRETTGSGAPFWLDANGRAWARAVGSVTMQNSYVINTDLGFWYDRDGDGVADDVEQVPWLDVYNGQQGGVIGEPIVLNYDIQWPEDIPEIGMGDTLIDARDGLPGVRNMKNLEIIFDTNHAVPGASSQLSDNATARVYNFSEPRTIDIGEAQAIYVTGTELTIEWDDNIQFTFPVRLNIDNGFYYFPHLPVHLKYRFYYNPFSGTKGHLAFEGGDYEPGSGQPVDIDAPNKVQLHNIMTKKEKAILSLLDNADGLANDVDEAEGTPWDTWLNQLYVHTRNPNGIDRNGDAIVDDELLMGLQSEPSNGKLLYHQQVLASAALSTALPKEIKEGYVTFAENNVEGGTVNVHVIKVVAPKVEGKLNVLLNKDNPLDERVAVMHNQSFGGKVADLQYEWWWHPANGNDVILDPKTLNAAQNPPYPWQKVVSEKGVNIALIDKGLPVLADGWIIGRYKGLKTGYDKQGEQWSNFAGHEVDAEGMVKPVYISGWVRRVIEAINTFEQRYNNFHDNEVNSYTSMLAQAGRPYQGDVALTTEDGNLDQVGLIELYQTVLNRAIALSIEANNPVLNQDAVNQQLLLASSRLATLYTLLGNEAYSDAMDPTVGISSNSSERGYLAPSLFAFQDQLANLLEEELGLLRGRDRRSSFPVHNRLIWNFSSGTEGESTYVQVYGISDGNSNNSLEDDAQRLFPQAHGDAWGHYLSASKYYYSLARHPNYNWKALTDTTVIAGIPVNVDYADEKRFAQIAEAKARAGLNIAELSFRKEYTHAAAGQWQGYKDHDPERAWGVDGWAKRATQSTYLDWVLGNALLAPEDSRKIDPLKKIDRKTLHALKKLPSYVAQVENLVAQADKGNNPLGLNADAIAFDIDPRKLDSGETHFEQIYERAKKSAVNSLQLFDYANDLTQQIRNDQMDNATFQRNVERRELAYKNQLIEYFGYPYQGQIGSGKLYPAGYTGPDLLHYQYIDATAAKPGLIDKNMTLTFKVPAGGSLLVATDFSADAEPDRYLCTGDGPEDSCPKDIDYPYTEQGPYPFYAQESWGRRRAPGLLQLQLGEIEALSAKAETESIKHRMLVNDIIQEINLLQQIQQVRDAQISVIDTRTGEFENFNGKAQRLQGSAQVLTQAGESIYRTISSSGDCLPRTFGFSVDGTAPARCAIYASGFGIASGVGVLAGGILTGSAIPSQVNAEKVNFKTRFEVQKAGFSLDIQKQLTVIEKMLNEEIVVRHQLVELYHKIENASSQYAATEAKAINILKERRLFREQTAAEVLDERYQDMTFRIFRNDALEKYRASFNVAASFTYLAAKAFDYETGLLSDDPTDLAFYDLLIKQRTLGQFVDGRPLSGVEGLSAPLAKMGQVFDEVKSSYGFVDEFNDQLSFSLRKEAFRISDNNISDTRWQKYLLQSMVADLWSLPEFRRFSRPPAGGGVDDGPLPGLVLRFSTMINSGKNLFGWRMGVGDSGYPSSVAATKFRRVGLHFENYPGDLLVATPYAYLIPVGTDVLRSPTQSGQLREYRVIEQAIPSPMEFGSGLDIGPDWSPRNDSVNGRWDMPRRFTEQRVSIDAQVDFDNIPATSRLIGRSVWNTDWLLIIPGVNLLGDGEEGLRRFINGHGETKGVQDIKLYFSTYSLSGQ